MTRVTRRSWAVVAVAVAALLGAGCDSGGDDKAAGGGETTGGATDDTAASGGGDGVTIDACTLLTDEEAGEILGAAIVGSGPTSGVGESVCAWEIEGDWSVVISVGSPGTALDNDFDPSVVFGGSGEEIATLEGAFYVGLNTVAFATDERLNTVQVVRPEGEEVSRSAAEELAPLVAERIEEAAG